MALLDNEFWINERMLLIRVLFPLVYNTILTSAERSIAKLISDIGIGVDWGLVNEDALTWAKRYVGEQITNINGTTQRYVQNAVSEWIGSGQHLDELTAQLEPMFGKTRAQMIASTEVTDAYAEGNLITWKDSKVVQKKRWMTASDERLCPICESMSGQEVDINGVFTDLNGQTYERPAAHVRCRCWMQPVVEV